MLILPIFYFIHGEAFDSADPEATPETYYLKVTPT